MRGRRYRVLFIILLFSVLLLSSRVGRLYADDGSVYRMRFLPHAIARSYFPAGDDYMIPVDERTATLIERARSYESEGNFRQALRYYSTAYRRAAQPATPYIAFKLCTLEEQNGEAIGCMKDLIDRSPDFPLIDAVRFELAFRLFLLGKTQESLRYLSLIEQNETGGAPIFMPSALYFSGIIEAYDGNPEVALVSFERAIESMNATGGEDYRNIYPGLYLEMAKVLFTLAEYDKSEALLIGIYGTAPLALEQSEALFYLGEVYTAQTEWDRAHAAYSELALQYGGTPFALQAQKKLDGMPDIEYQNLTLQPVYNESLLTGRYGLDESTAIETVDEAAGSGAYALQLGSFSSEENAQGLVEQLQNLDFPAFLVQAQVEEVYYYRVRVGFYESKEEARKVLQALGELGYSGYILKDE